MKKSIGIVLLCAMLCGCSSDSTGKSTEHVTTTLQTVAVISTTETQTTTEELTTIENQTSETTEASTQSGGQGTISPESIYVNMCSNFYFSSGAGGWSTILTVNDDGTFSGVYHDYDYGITSDEYPNGTEYVSSFSGKFSEPVKIDDYTYQATIETITTDNEIDSEKIIAGVRYVYTPPYGLADCTHIEIYLPGKPTSELSDDYLSWCTMKFYEGTPDTLPFYGIYNVDEGDGFVGDDN